MTVNKINDVVVDDRINIRNEKEISKLEYRENFNIYNEMNDSNKNTQTNNKMEDTNEIDELNADDANESNDSNSSEELALNNEDMENAVDPEICEDTVNQKDENNINRSKNKTYVLGKEIGNGSFGVVYEAICVEDTEQVAIKRVLQDPQYKNREINIMKQLKHNNIITLKDYYFYDVTLKNKMEIYLNVVMEYIPHTVHRYIKYYKETSKLFPTFLVKIYSFQLCRALAYIHSLNICHRDLKPQNLLIDSKTQTLKLCDFGSAKVLVPGQWSISYICSRYYRAPELILGCTYYTTKIDSWSVGCIIAELLLGTPLFSGLSSVDQFIRIIQILGTPTEKQLKNMNITYPVTKFPSMKPKDLEKVFPKGTSKDAINFLSKFLKYVPEERISCLEALADPFFDDIKSPNLVAPEYIKKLPNLFNFSEDEINLMDADLFQKIVPRHACENYDTILENKKKENYQPKKCELEKEQIN